MVPSSVIALAIVCTFPTTTVLVSMGLSRKMFRTIRWITGVNSFNLNYCRRDYVEKDC